jgi:hypothetical protein
MQDAPTVVGDEKEAVENPEGDGVYGEEVHRGDGFPMVLQECLPSIPFLRISRGLLDPTRYRAFCNIEAKHLQFPVDARCAPAGILCRHFAYQFSQLPADSLPSEANLMAG